MNELQPYFVKYLTYYIEALTKGREEFFLSLCDIEEEFLEEIVSAEFPKYQVIIVDREDYSEAVRFRNDISFKRIVLLSGEGVKQIDSLKDFNEYSILSQEHSLMWGCFERTFGITLEPKVRGFLDGILEQGEIFFREFFAYLKKSIIKKQISPAKLNQNLPMLGIWKSKKTEVLGKGEIRAMIRNSRYSVVDNRLTMALMNHKIHNEKLERKISLALSKGDIQSIFSSIDYEQAKQWLKQAPKEKRENHPDSVLADEKSYGNSFAYKLSENLPDDIREIEQKWIEDRNKEDPEFDVEWKRYPVLEKEVSDQVDQLSSMMRKLDASNLSTRRREKIKEKLSQLKEALLEAREAICLATPVCLASFCAGTAEYTRIYFELLSEMITNDIFREDMIGTREYVEGILLLFCKEQENSIFMPFYHPIRVYYYMTMCRLYESIVPELEENEQKNEVWYTLVDKVAMQFPVEFIKVGKKCYALDNTTILKKDLNYVSTDIGTVYSVLDFKIVQQQILDYIMLHPYLTNFTICLMDISELSGLSRLVAEIQELAGKEEYNIGRVEFLILSSKEEELKKMLSQMWDAIGADNIVRFRFARKRYLANGKYDLKKIVEEADMTIMADNDLLYREPRMVASKNLTNTLYNRLNEFDIEKQVKQYMQSGKSDIPVIWDTVQQIASEGQEGFWQWKSRELDSRILELINQIVQEQKDKSIVILSSNEHILSEIHQTKYIKANRKKYNGKSITILRFGSEQKDDSDNGGGKISCSMEALYDEALGLEDMPKKLLSGVEDILMEISNDMGRTCCKCTALIKEEGIEIPEDWEDQCEKWMDWQFNDFFHKTNVLTDYFRELWRNQLNAGGSGMVAILLAENLCRGEKLTYDYKTEDLNKRENSKRKETDCMQAVKVHEMLQFIMEKRTIDEKAVSQFKERYDYELVKNILATENCKNLLEEDEYTNLQKIGERIRDN